MKPTQGKCKDCKYAMLADIEIKPIGFHFDCEKLNSKVYGTWTGCVMWEKK